MKSLFIVGLFAVLAGCATNRVTLDTLMRTSYEIGCGEARLNEVDKPLVKHKAQTEGVLQLCRDKAKKDFDLRQTGVYDERMEIFYRQNQIDRK